ncbi:MAG: hypothetical protein UT03_C0049G0007 [Candidatus Moranbacteria bacterium GW2011_GWD2_38_7]|nr:MAG: hypothetical protein UT03_C0049G0007 [Candidatus Moranbacteria bacterium GW2011_GWD2_38_7]
MAHRAWGKGHRAKSKAQRAKSNGKIQVAGFRDIRESIIV